ncbi:hypothetical protein RradSPS_2599 [Rubrobacter radiotolerans]|uniref:DUF305 domain-containing protein n=1 Tax=Rubrobacter radiotolerans TaxID=42256 RepID=A0A023X5X6_RUBRA|nr:DUF305 domain-containing protein [Rubrobacter radiotolerans]AHY47882.1 hypothetical protein RradSPS_2599 [Rubrobacter radiotolerans]MDX5892520.1 DUF305 domain-containing protein [Rubrobacter radiotolerans]SMC07811.1 Uncharacterized conserved protein, DUF305 family [Rubrobacter radiotolerans DSM 5868]
MKERTRLGVGALLATLVLTLAACGGQGQEAQRGNTDAGAPQTTPQERPVAQDETTGMRGAGHSGMNHGGMGPGGMDMESMLTENGQYSDRRFIDMMVPHHVGAVEMAEVALDGNAEHEEIVQLSRDIIRTQNAEIEELRQIKEERFGTSEVPMDMSDEEMRTMGMGMNARDLANEEPFDLAFIEQMIPHHQSAIEMSEVARQNTDDPQIRELAEEIIAAQEREISEMESWREEWYPEAR